MGTSLHLVVCSMAAYKTGPSLNAFMLQLISIAMSCRAEVTSSITVAACHMHWCSAGGLLTQCLSGISAHSCPCLLLQGLECDPQHSAAIWLYMALPQTPLKSICAALQGLSAAGVARTAVRQCCLWQPPLQLPPLWRLLLSARRQQASLLLT